MGMSNCYVCGFSTNCSQAKGLSFHQASRKLSNRPTLEKWLKFLCLPPSNTWPNLEWQRITLCSRHFQEEDFQGRQMCLRKALKNDAVPTRNPPKGPGRYAPLFQERKTNSESPPPVEEQEEMITGHFTLKLLDDLCYDLIPTEEDHSDQETTEGDHSDSAYLDNDCNNIADSDELKEIENSNDLPMQSMLQDVRKKLCRLCGQKGHLLKPIIDPLSTETKDISMAEKIQMHLPFKVNADDVLPCLICLDCSIGLNRWHELYVTCVAADAVLKKTFCGDGESMMSSQERWNHSAKSDLDLINTCARDTDHLVGAESHEVIDIVNAVCDIDSLHEADERNKILCTVCGMNTPMKSPKEDDLTVKEFESLYSVVPLSTYKCRYCYEFFHSSVVKKEHGKNCRELSTICEICGRKVRRKNLLKHKYQHHERPCSCNKCGKLFKNPHLLNQHIYRIHEQDLSPKYCCTLCCIAFAKKDNYRTHQKKHKTGKVKTRYGIKEQPEGVYICQVCNGTFKDALSLVVHLTSKRKMKCPSCLKELSNEKMLLVHKCNKYKCRYCHKSYNLKILWVEHERIHTGEKPIKCRMCDKSFHSFHSRNTHEKTHAPPYQCPICRKKFSHKHVYEDHIQRHQGKFLVCPICKKKFSSRTGIAKHVKKYHKNCNIKVEWT